jgi:hypothetical protein
MATDTSDTEESPQGSCYTCGYLARRDKPWLKRVFPKDFRP